MLSCVTVTQALCIAVAAMTLLPHVRDRLPPGDSGELLACVASLCTIHPPGYPLFQWLYYGWIRVAASLGTREYHLLVSVTFACNLLTALLTSASVGVLASLCMRCIATQLTDGKGGATKILSVAMSTCGCVLVAVILRASPSLMEHGTTTEVFGLHLMFVAMTLSALHSFLVVGHNGGRLGRLLLLAILAAFSLCNQHTSLFLVFPTVVGVGSVLRWSVTWWLALAVGAATICVAYGSLMLTNGDDLYSWGDVHDGFGGIVTHVLRVAYGTLKLHSGRSIATSDATQRIAAPWWNTNKACALWLMENMPIPAVAIALWEAMAGMLSTMRRVWRSRRHRTAAAMALQREESRFDDASYDVMSLVCTAYVLLGTLGFFNVFVNLPVLESALYTHVVARLWLHMLIPLWLLFSLGVARWLRFCKCRDVLHVCSCALIVVAVLLSSMPISTTDSSDPAVFSLLDAYAEAALFDLPSDSVLITVGDQSLTAFRHAQRARHRRPDVLHVDREMSWYPWFASRLERINTNKTNHTGVSVEWPVQAREKYPTGRTGGFVNLHDLLVVNLPSGKTKSGRSWKPPRQRPPPRHFFVLEDPEMASEKPHVKESFELRFQGWFYQVLERSALQSDSVRCPTKSLTHIGDDPSSSPSSGCDWLVMPPPLRRFECLVWAHNSTFVWEEVRSSSALQLCINDSREVSLPPVLQASIRNDTALALHHPWQALVLQQYHLSVQKALLQAAHDVQVHCESRPEALRGLRCIRRAALKRLQPQYFIQSEVYESVVRRFMGVLNQTIDMLQRG